MTERAICLIELCSRVAKSRGLCSHCYNLARNAVFTGVATWDDLEALGLSLPPARRGPKPASLFARAFDKAREEGRP